MRRRFVRVGMVVVAVAAGVAVLASAASGTNTKAEGGKQTIHVAVFLASAANSYWAAELVGAKDVAKKNPNVKLTVFDGKFTTNTQVNQLRDALVSKKYQAWFVGPNDGGPLAPTIKQAIAQGVKVGCALVPCGPNVRDVHVQIPGQVIFAGLGFYPNGVQLGQLVVQGCQGISDCQVLWLPGLPTLPLEKARQAGMYSVIKSHKNIHVVAVAAGGYLAAPALTATENVLKAHPNLNVVVSSGDQMIEGAYKAEQLAGKSGIKMYGNGCTIGAKQRILQGTQTGCSVYMPRTEGRLVVQALVNAVEGKLKQTGIYVNPLKYSPIGGLGTKANIAKFTPEFTD